MTPFPKLPASAALVCLLFAHSTHAASYEGAVRGVLQQYCVACHGAGRPSGGLDLSTYEAILAGNDSGEVVVRGEPDDSYLYLVTAHAEEPAMPPSGKRIPDADLTTLRRWIELGLPEKDDDIDLTAAPTHSESPPMEIAAKLAISADQAPAQHGPVVAMAASEASDRLAVGRQLAIWLYEASTQRPIGVLPFPEGEPQSLRFSADGKWLTAAGGVHGQSGAVVVWRLDTQPKRAWIWDDAYDAVLTADLSPDRQRVVIGDSTREVRIVSTLSGEVVHTHVKPTDWVLQTRFSADGLLVAATDRDGGVYVWETASGALLHSLRGHKDAVIALEWLDGGNQLATSSFDGDVRLWDMHSGEAVHRWTAHESGVADLASDRRGSLLTVERDGRKVSRWNSDDGSQLTAAETTSHRLLTIASANPSSIFVGTQDGAVLVLVADSTWAELPHSASPPGGVLVTAPAPSDARLALEITASPSTMEVATRNASAVGLQIAEDSRKNSPSPTNLNSFEQGVRHAHYLESIGELRRLQKRLQELEGGVSHELQKTLVLLSIARERLEKALKSEYGDQDAAYPGSSAAAAGGATTRPVGQ